MTATPTGIVKVMDGWLLWHIYHEHQNPITTQTQKQNACVLSILLLGYLTTKGFQNIWQIKLDYMGNLRGVLVM
jgi:hypothetical protein